MSASEVKTVWALHPIEVGAGEVCEGRWDGVFGSVFGFFLPANSVKSLCEEDGGDVLRVVSEGATCGVGDLLSPVFFAGVSFSGNARIEATKSSRELSTGVAEHTAGFEAILSKRKDWLMRLP